MVGVIIIGRSFGNLAHYALNEEKTATVLAAHGVRSWSAGEMAADFEAQHRPGLNRAVLHVALAWPKQEQAKMSDALMAELATAYMAKMGMSPANTQWALVRHNDRPHPHCHLIVNLVDNDGKVLDDANNFQRSKDACRVLEKRYQLLDAAAIGADQQLEKARLGQLPGYEAARAYIQDALRRHLPGATTPQDLGTALAGEGIAMRGTYQAQQLLTVVFERGGEFVKGSAIGKEFGGKKLGEALAQQHAHAQAAAATHQQQKEGPRASAPPDRPRGAVVPAWSVEKSLPAEPQPVPVETPAGQLEKPVSAGPVLAPVPPVARPAVPQGARDAPVPQPEHPVAAPPRPPVSAGERTPGAPPPTETQRQSAIFRAAAAGEWDALDEAKVLIYHVLTKALVTTETDSKNIMKAVEKQGFAFSPDGTQIGHGESRLKVRLADAQPGGGKAPSFGEQVEAVAWANRVAQRESAQEATREILAAFLAAKPHFIGRGELVEQCDKVGLAASWPGQKAGKGGTLTLTHVARGHSFSHEELPVHGQPLLPQVQALAEANRDNPERTVRILYRDEAQATKMKVALAQAGVEWLPAEPGSARTFVANYRLDSPNLAQIDAIFVKINTSDGAQVLESGAAAEQREARAYGGADQKADVQQQAR